MYNTTYPKIQTVFKRHPVTHKIMEGLFTYLEFEDLMGIPWHATEKIDGMNIRVFKENGKLEVRGKTDNAQIPMDLYNWIRDNIDIKLLSEGMILYGEGFGPGIQKVGSKYSKYKSFILFDVYFRECWYDYLTVREVANGLKIRSAPLLDTTDLNTIIEIVRKGFPSKINSDIIAEGIVARPVNGYLTQYGKRIITKIKHIDFAV